MPWKPKQYHSSGKTRLERRREYDQNRPAWHRWYSKEPWLTIRRVQLAQSPLCVDCLKEGIERLAQVVDHVEPHKGDWHKFISGPFESLCKRHHDRRTALTERFGQ